MSRPARDDFDDDSPLLCFCNRVRESTVRAAIDGGVTDLEALIEATRAATGCGTCRFELIALLREARAGGAHDAGGDPERGAAERNTLVSIAVLLVVLSGLLLLGPTLLRWSGLESPGPERVVGEPGSGESAERPPGEPGNPEAPLVSRDLGVGTPSDPASAADPAASESVAPDGHQVVDAFGRPIGGVALEWFQAGRSVGVASSSATGSFEVPAGAASPTGEAWLLLQHPEFEPRVLEWRPVRLGEVVLQTRPGIEVSVFGDDDRPLPGARVVWRPRRMDHRIGITMSERLERRGTTGPDGRVALRGTPRCEGQLRVEAAGYRTTAAPVDPDRNRGPVEIRLPIGRSVRGRLLDDRGDPVPEIRVLATPNDGGESVWAVSASDGGFRWSGLGPGPFAAAAEVSGRWLPVKVQPSDDRRVETYRLPALRTLRGTVVDRGGLRLGNARLELWTDGRLEARTIGADGRFQIQHWPVGRSVLRVASDGFVSASVTCNDRLPNPLELRLETAPVASGRILDTKGDPIQGARVDLLSADAETVPDTDRSGVRTDSDGHFELLFCCEAPTARLRIRSEDRPTVVSEVIERPETPGRRLDLGSIRVPVASLLQVELTGDLAHYPRPELIRTEPTHPESLVSVDVLRPLATPLETLDRVAARSFESGPLRSGTYRLLLRPTPLDDRPPMWRTVSLTAGRTERLVLTEADPLWHRLTSPD